VKLVKRVVKVFKLENGKQEVRMAEETLPLPDIPSHFFVKTHKVVKRLDSAAYDKEFHS